MNNETPIYIDLFNTAQDTIGRSFFDRIYHELCKHWSRGAKPEAIIISIAGSTIYGLPVFSSQGEYATWKERERINKLPHYY